MDIVKLSRLIDRDRWIKRIAESDWRAGKYLAQLLETGKFRELCGEYADVLLLTENDRLLSFCTLAQQDEIADSGLEPWIGFVYTFPSFRGNRLIGKLIDFACSLARDMGHRAIYVSTDQPGLYENFGFSLTGLREMSIYGEMPLIYKRELSKGDC